MKIYTNGKFYTEIADVVRAFGFDATESTFEQANLLVMGKLDGQIYHTRCTVDGIEKEYEINCPIDDEIMSVRLQKRYDKLATYYCLKQLTGRQLPWGSLTGIRPTRLAEEIQRNEGLDYVKTFRDLLDVTDEKLTLVKDILDAQSGLKNKDASLVDLYVGIPFCISKCTYCSFTSGIISKLKHLVEPYVSSLCDEIKLTVNLIEKKGLRLKNLYIGGGTPTSLEVEDLRKILSVLPRCDGEFTVEAGRPDTITVEKLQLFKEFGVNRISINPQTFNQSVLDSVNRCHTTQDIYDKYNLAKSFGFCINMDLIAGLPTESFEMFCNSINQVVALDPENVTVHTLALKKGSLLKEQNFVASDATVAQMVNFARQKLNEAGYLPYYMYRQKYMTENLENVGFCKSGTQCLYNIDNMEETTSILACGANAITKRIFQNGGRIERVANQKDVITYIEKYKSNLEKKKALFDL
ncbi:MAG: coproporphyrinogen dehydrogenase HemZ [Clostridia bacterium]|nr:coproporphyrinogen dehydrogenase HemZ [Clostridia bacterium]